MENPEQIITRSRQYGKLFEQLRKEMDALGYRLLAPGQLDPYTIEQCAEVAEAYDNPSKLLLVGGEMTAQELRTARAVVRMLAAAIRSLKGDG